MELTIDQALQKGIEAHKAGQIQEADRLYTAIIEVQPKHPYANHNLGVLAVSVGKVQDALPFLKAALDTNPNTAQFWLSYIDALIKLERLTDAKVLLDQARSNGAKGERFDELKQRLDGVEPAGTTVYQNQDPPKDQLQFLINLYRQGQLQEVSDEAKQLLKQFPNSVTVYNIQGAANAGLGQLDAATYSFKKVLSIEPENSDAYNNIGNVLKEHGKLEEAIEAYNKALDIKPNISEAYYNMGISLQEQDKLKEAVEAYNRALTIKPDYAEAYANMGNALKEQGKLKEAISAYNNALNSKPDYADAHYNLGNTFQEQGKLKEAIAAYNKALSIRPNYVDAWLNGAEALEKWNKLEELNQWLDQAFRSLKTISSDMRLLRAKLLWRKKHYKQALKLISAIDYDTVTDVRKQDFLNLKGKCLESFRDFDGAFDCFSKMNLLAKKSIRNLEYNPENYFSGIKDDLRKLKLRSVSTTLDSTLDKKNFSPVFLVGFPRSGTTLLDTILRTHSSIQVVEEQMAVNAAKTFIMESGYNGLLEQALPPEILLSAKNAYQLELFQHTNKVSSKSVYIDKLPLNLLDAPIIHQLYPEAKFILTLRHPMDTILSCWVQDFKLNAAMANMVDLDRIVEFYCVAMETFELCSINYGLSVHLIRYEDLIDGLKSETTALLKFLDLNWESQMENYSDTALKRGLINTPSYSQVVQPIYKDAKYRWLNYENYLEKHLEKIKPWIDKFGYSK